MLLPQSCGPGPPPPPPPPPPPIATATAQTPIELSMCASKRKTQPATTIAAVATVNTGYRSSARIDCAKTTNSDEATATATTAAATTDAAAMKCTADSFDHFSIRTAATVKHGNKNCSQSGNKKQNIPLQNMLNDGKKSQQQQQKIQRSRPNSQLPMTSAATPTANASETAATATATTATTCATTVGQTLSNSVAMKWLLTLLLLFAVLAQTPYQVGAEKSKHYYMQSLCKNHFLQQLYRKIDGAVLWSQNERNLDCIITFQTHSILQRFMLRFDMLQLDCNDHLYVYDGAHAVATPKVDISCRNTKQTVSLILTRTNFVTLKYVTDGWGTDANGFKLVITSVKDPKHTCKDFTCATREFCISPDLLCDGINHCGDNSDESVHNLCQNEAATTIFGVDMTWFVLIVVGIVLVISALIVGISICVCRRQEENNLNQSTAMQLHHAAETNGSSKHLHYHHGGTLSREHTQLPPTSGNWHHPAGPSGYHRIIQHNLSKMATKVRPIWCLANSVN